ncbi:RluA family pseudouridine synthase [Candidatus Saccharibacteria bacterium]|nr:RluA family pseudouridine synthase [Candidatus Saccharibacteria bacterium]
MATKNLKREALAILRDFEVAGEVHTSADIESVKETSLRAATRQLTIQFDNAVYLAIIDNTIDDDTVPLQEILSSGRPGLKGRFLRNPRENDFITFGIRHKFRDTYLFQVEPTFVRLDKELAARYPDLSRSTIQKYIKAGYVQVAGETVTKASTDVSDMATIALTLPEKQDTSGDTLPILYIDDNVIVVNKPAGVLTHSKGVMNDEFTVADFFRRYTTFGITTNRPGIVHRLDRDTSGVIIGARTDEAAALLKKQFADRTVKKHYTAVVDGVPKLEKAIIDVPIARNPSAPSTFRVDPKGKPALTSYEVMSSNGKQTLVELRPKTGRTHQLRVHMQYIHTPIAGDRVYGSAQSAPRLCLHAHSLELTLPGSHRHTFTAPVPSLFEEMVQ